MENGKRGKREDEDETRLHFLLSPPYYFLFYFLPVLSSSSLQFHFPGFESNTPYTIQENIFWRKGKGKEEKATLITSLPLPFSHSHFLSPLHISTLVPQGTFGYGFQWIWMNEREKEKAREKVNP